MSKLDQKALDAAVEAMAKALVSPVPADAKHYQEAVCRAAITAYLSSSPAAEPVAWFIPWARFEGDTKGLRQVADGLEGRSDAFPLYAAPVELDGLRRELEATKALALHEAWGRGTAAEKLETLQAEFDEAVRLLRPFAATVYRDNGDVTYSFNRARPTDYLAAYIFLSRLSRKDTDNG